MSKSYRRHPNSGHVPYPDQSGRYLVDETVTGDEWEPFVALGFVVAVDEPTAQAPAPSAPAPPVAATPEVPTATATTEPSESAEPAESADSSTDESQPTRGRRRRSIVNE